MKGVQARNPYQSKQTAKTGHVPNARITIKVDELIKNTYSGIITSRVRSFIEDDVTSSNQLLV